MGYLSTAVVVKDARLEVCLKLSTLHIIFRDDAGIRTYIDLQPLVTDIIHLYVCKKLVWRWLSLCRLSVDLVSCDGAYIVQRLRILAGFDGLGFVLVLPAYFHVVTLFLKGVAYCVLG